MTSRQERDFNMTEDALRNYESEAVQQGWKPKEEFTGDPERWVDAETFVKRGDQFVGLMKPKLEKIEQKLAYQERLNKDMKEHIELVKKQKDREIEQLENKLKEDRRKAIAAGDGLAFDKAEAGLEEVREAKTQVKNPQGPPPNGETPQWAKEWIEENPWYNTDPVLRRFADSYADELRILNPSGLPDKEFLNKVSEYTKAELPHKFSKPKRNSDVEGGGNRSNDSLELSDGPKNYSALPAEAKATCNRLMREGIIKDKEEYARLYFE